MPPWSVLNRLQVHHIWGPEVLKLGGGEPKR